MGINPLRILLLSTILAITLFSPPAQCGDWLDTWTWRNPLPQGNPLLSVAYGHGSFVAVGSFGTILTSSDGVAWTLQNSGTMNWLWAVTYANNTFVAVGDNGTILTSLDGLTWASQSSGISGCLYGVTYGKNTFVAVGDPGRILTSPDGVTWTSQTSGTLQGLMGVTYGNGTFVAVGLGTILTSADGVTWKTRPWRCTQWLWDVVYVNGTFVIVGDGGTIIQSNPAPGIALSPGWNFVSFLKQPQNTAVEAVLGEAAANTAIVWGYDDQGKAWKKWTPTGIANTLLAMESGKGYWIYMTAPAMIDMTGWTAPTTSVHLYPGWNLVGYAGTEKRNVLSALSTLLGTWSLTWNWENSRWAVKSRTSTTLPVEVLDTFRQMKAYWIKMDGAADWAQ
jgi:hypothetical protein